MSPPAGERRARAAVLAAAVAFGTTGTAQAKGPAGITPLGVGAVRILLGASALVVVAMALLRRHSEVRLPRRRHWRAVCVGGAGVALYQPMFFAGTERSGVAVGTIVALGSGPVFVGLWEAGTLRRRPEPAWVAATGLAITGGGVLVAAQGGGGRVDAVGVLCALAAGLGYAMYASAGKALIQATVDSTVAMAWIFGAGAVLLAPALATEPLGWLRSGRGVLMIVHLGLVTVTLAYILYGFGLRALPTSTVVTLTLAEPLTAALAGAVVLGERLSTLAWSGAVLVVCGLALTALPRRLRPASAVTRRL